MRYLLYYVTKQDRPWFTNEFDPADYQEDYDIVVVDLIERKRLWGGEWRPCDVHENGQWRSAQEGK